MKRRKLNIGIVSFYNPHLGGSSVVAIRQAIQLAKRGHRIFMISDSNAYNTESLHELGLNFFPVSSVDHPTLRAEPFTIELASKIAEVHESFGLDLVHAHYAVPHAVACMLAQEITKIPYFVTMHGSDATELAPNPAIRPVLNLALKKAEKVFFVSEFLRKFSRDAGVYTENSQVTHNFVPINLYSRTPVPHLKKSLDIPSNATIIMHASNLREIKRPLDIIEAAAMVLQEHHNVYFLIVGEGPMLETCKTRAQELEIDKKVLFVGRRDNLHDWLSIADIFIMASEFEGFGLAVMEAMAASVPVISSECGGPREIIEENKSGLFFEVGNIEQLAERISYLLKNPKIREKMAENAAKRIRRDFSEKKIINELETAYFKALEDRNK